MDDDAELPRETGAEKAGRQCPGCGGEMQVTESKYGSIVAVCPKCSASAPEVPTQTASELPTINSPSALQRLLGTDKNKEESDGGR